jgi:hypothetical protein
VAAGGTGDQATEDTRRGALADVADEDRRSGPGPEDREGVRGSGVPGAAPAEIDAAARCPPGDERDGRKGADHVAETDGGEDRDRRTH